MNMRFMTPDEFELHRREGHTSRQLLYEIVIRELHIPKGWTITQEYQQEFGGLSPVCLRFYPVHGRFLAMLCSPGEISTDWMFILISSGGRRVKVIRRISWFNSVLINELLMKVDTLDKNGYILEGVIATLDDVNR